jgi:hypothetical protein
MKTFLIFMLALFSLNIFAAPTPNERQEFRALIDQVAKKTQTQFLQCEQQDMDGTMSSIQYKLEINNVSDYQDAFMIKFSNETRTWSTLVAYEGYNGYVMGKLKVDDIDNSRVYNHYFYGYFVDNLTLIKTNGSFENLAFNKTASGDLIILKMDCHFN